MSDDLLEQMEECDDSDDFGALLYKCPVTKIAYDDLMFYENLVRNTLTAPEKRKAMIAESAEHLIERGFGDSIETVLKYFSVHLKGCEGCTDQYINISNVMKHTSSDIEEDDILLQ